jgi:hypothetical protein
MSNEEPRIFTGAETLAHPDPLCPTCGQRAEQQWVHVGDVNDHDRWQAGRIHCPNAKNHPNVA